MTKSVPSDSYLREDWTSLAAEVVEVEEREEVVERESWAGVDPRLGFLVGCCCWSPIWPRSGPICPRLGFRPLLRVPRESSSSASLLIVDILVGVVAMAVIITTTTITNIITTTISTITTTITSIAIIEPDATAKFVPHTV